MDVRHFGEQTRVIAVAPGYEQILGARVLAIQDTPTQQARQLAAALTPMAETDSLREARIDGFLTTGMLLHGCRVTSNRSTAQYKATGENEKPLTIELKALAAGFPKQEELQSVINRLQSATSEDMLQGHSHIASRDGTVGVFTGVTVASEERVR